MANDGPVFWPHDRPRQAGLVFPLSIVSSRPVEIVLDGPVAALAASAKASAAKNARGDVRVAVRSRFCRRRSIRLCRPSRPGGEQEAEKCSRKGTALGDLIQWKPRGRPYGFGFPRACRSFLDDLRAKLELVARGGIEVSRFRVRRRLVVLHGQEICRLWHRGCSERCSGLHPMASMEDQGAFEVEAFHQRRDGGDLVGFFVGLASWPRSHQSAGGSANAENGTEGLHLAPRLRSWLHSARLYRRSPQGGGLVRPAFGHPRGKTGRKTAPDRIGRRYDSHASRRMGCAK